MNRGQLWQALHLWPLSTTTIECPGGFNIALSIIDNLMKYEKTKQTQQQQHCTKRAAAMLQMWVYVIHFMCSTAKPHQWCVDVFHVKSLAEGASLLNLAQDNISSDVTCIKAKQTWFPLTAKPERWQPYLVHCRSSARPWDSVGWLLLKQNTICQSHTHTVNTQNNGYSKMSETSFTILETLVWFVGLNRSNNYCDARTHTNRFYLLLIYSIVIL